MLLVCELLSIGSFPFTNLTFPDCLAFRGGDINLSGHSLLLFGRKERFIFVLQNDDESRDNARCGKDQGRSEDINLLTLLVFAQSTIFVSMNRVDDAMFGLEMTP